MYIYWPLCTIQYHINTKVKTEYCVISPDCFAFHSKDVLTDLEYVGYIVGIKFISLVIKSIIYFQEKQELS